MKRKGFLIIALLIAFGILFAGCTPEGTPTLSLSSATFSTVVGETTTIKPTVGGVEGLTLTYASSDEAVATVADGVVTAKAPGTAKITVSLTDYPEVKVEATVVVKAKAPVTLKFSSASVTTVVGQTLTVAPSIGGTTEQLELAYASSDTKVATVAAGGVVTAVGAGNAVITVSVKNQADVKAQVTVKVLPLAPVTLRFSSASVTTVAGRTLTVVPTIGGTTEQLELVYASSDTKVATVSDKGVVSAVAAGQAVITVSVKNQADIKATVTVTVLAVATVNDFAPKKIVILGQDEMFVGDTAEFPTTITPNAAYKGLLWSTSDPSVATVDGSGNVTAHKSGSATITAVSALDEAVSGTFEVEVFERGTDAEIGLRALDYIKANMPEFANADFTLPVYPNDKVMVTWTKSDATTIDDGVFPVGTITADAQTALTCKVEYGDFTVEEVLSLKLVTDLVNNGFTANQIIKDYLDAYFFNYTKENPETLAQDVVLPTVVQASAINWASSAGAVLSKTGLYVRPNDDQYVTLSATVTTAGVGMPLEYKVFVKGYTMEEKVAFILDEGDLLPYKDLKAQSNIVLPTRDSKFNLLMAWASSDATVLDNTGAYVNRDLAQDTDITYTVTFTDDRFEPHEVETKTVAVKALKATDTSKAVYDFTHNAALMAAVPTYFPYGVKGRAGDNTITGLATTLEGHDGVTIEWSGNEEDFDGLTLKTQYLRYHESLLTAKFKKAGVVPTSISFVVNTGISKDVNAMYIGGRFSEQTTTVAKDKYDLLNTFSYFDQAVGKTAYSGQQYWSAYSGFTFYVNGEVDALPVPTTFTEKADGQRFQYFPMDFVTVYITAVDDNGTITGWEYANLREKTGGNWAILFVNLTDKVAKVPLASHAAGKGTDDQPWIGQGSRENALTFDGYRKGFTADATGKVVLGSKFGVLQDVLPSTARSVDIPANGYGMTFKTQENQPIVGIFCHPGTQMTFEHYNLAPENDFRYMHFNYYIDLAKTKLDKYDAAKADPAVEMAAVFPSGTGDKTPEKIAEAIADYYDGLSSGADANLKTSEYYSKYDHAVLTPLADITFDMASFNAQTARSALLWDAKIATLKTQTGDADYLVKAYAIYKPFSALTDGIKNIIVDKAWLENEYETKLNKTFYVNLVLNGGQVYASTRKEVTDMFLVDMYAHLKAKNYPDLPTFEVFVDQTAATPYLTTLMTDAFMREYMYDLYKDNADDTPDPDHLKIDDTSNDFFRQTAYHDKWLPLLIWLNDTTQIGHAGGRDILGRFGLKYEFVYVKPAEGSKLYDITVSAIAGATSRFREYITGKYAYVYYRERFLADTWTLGVDESQTKVNAMGLKYTPGDAKVELPKVVKAGFTLEWYLDEAFTKKATLTPVELGFKDVTLYAKWTAVNP